MTTGPITQTIEQAFSAIIAALGRFVGSRRETRTKWGDAIEPLPVPLIVAVYARLININRRFQALMVQIRAGTLREPRARRPEEAARRKARRAELAAMDPPPPRPPPHRELPEAYGPMAPLPRDFGYVKRLVPWHAAPLAHQMQVLLARPEMAEIIAATPRLQRVLRPLCHMLGIDPAGLIPPTPPAPPPPSATRVQASGPPPDAARPAACSAGEAAGADLARPRGAGPVELRAVGPPVGGAPEGSRWRGTVVADLLRSVNEISPVARHLMPGGDHTHPPPMIRHGRRRPTIHGFLLAAPGKGVDPRPSPRMTVKTGQPAAIPAQPSWLIRPTGHRRG